MRRSSSKGFTDWRISPPRPDLLPIVGSALLASGHNKGSAITNTVALTIFVVAASVSLGLLAWMGLTSRRVRAHRRN